MHNRATAERRDRQRGDPKSARTFSAPFLSFFALGFSGVSLDESMASRSLLLPFGLVFANTGVESPLIDWSDDELGATDVVDGFVRND